MRPAQRRKWRRVQGPVATAVLLLALSPAAGSSAGPPADRVNRPPGDATCRDFGCHGTTALATNNGNLSLAGLHRRFSSSPDFKTTYMTGLLHDLSFTHSDPGIRRWGFELAVLDPTGQANAGALQVTDAVNTQIISDAGGRTYIESTRPGTCHDGGCSTVVGCPDTRTWTFAWQAPAMDQAVVFYTCSNASNGDCQASGQDRIRCARLTAVSDPSLDVVLLGIDPTQDVRLEWSGGVPPYNVWMHTLPDFDQPDGGNVPQAAVGLSRTDLVLPDCGGTVCYYLVE